MGVRPVPICTPGTQQRMAVQSRGLAQEGARPRQQARLRVPRRAGREGCLIQPQACSYRKNYEALWQMYKKIQPLLENLHRNFLETQNNITCDIQKLCDKDPLGNVLIDKKSLEKILLLSYVCNPRAGASQRCLLEHSCVINIGVGKNLDMLNNLINFLDLVFAEHLKGKGAGAVQSLFPWFCLCFQRAFKSFEDVWRLWEVLLTGKPCRNFQVLVAYSLLQMVRGQVLQESMAGNDILLACNRLVDLDADELISSACLVYADLIQKDVSCLVIFPSPLPHPRSVS
ncbi:PREDICTED: TBC1 domain family member 21 [Hipposideros armiger]|uniref:TBC1 domain family member 21 n=1 Tax=Hipposideros armiger TaxID=186990 RepID=A0A8B7TCQ4_HIPAR|nr:PREDICTED: TBC1 domain family member 21 [Hipposideros armiger]